MKPSDAQLVRAADSAIRQAIGAPGLIDIGNILNGVHVILNELRLRQLPKFYAAFHRQGVALAREGAALCGIAPPAEITLARGAIDAVDAILAHNAALAGKLTGHSAAAARDLLERLVEWELSLFARRMEEAAHDTAEDPRTRLTGERFQAYLREHRPEWRDVEVRGFRIQAGGNSKQTALADCHDPVQGDFSVAIRAEPPRRFMDLDGMRIEMEYPVVRLAFEAGLCAPEPLLLETDARHLGMPFIVSRKMPGVIKGDVKGSAEPMGEAALKAVIGLIARIANTPIDPGSPHIRSSHLRRWIAHPTLADNSRDLVCYWRDAGRAGNMSPSSLATRGIDWLLANVPQEDARQNLIHGDIGFHNILFDGDRLSALLDWENSRIGDTAEELANFMVAVAGQASREQIMAWYGEAGGPPLSDYRIRYFEVYCCVKMVIAALVSIQRVDEQPENSLSAAVFGLRYLHYIGSQLNELIRLAEKARRPGD